MNTTVFTTAASRLLAGVAVALIVAVLSVPAWLPTSAVAAEPAAATPSADELFQRLQEPYRFVEMDAANPEESQKKLIAFALKAATDVLAHPKATEQQQEQARLVKVSILHRNATENASEYPAFEKWVNEIATKAPNSDAAGIGMGLILIDKLTSGNPPADAGEQVKAFAEKYPDNPVTLQIYAIYGRHLAGSGQVKEAKAVFEEAMARYPALVGSPNLAMIEESLAQLNMIGQQIEISGPGLQPGSTVKLEDFRGKVVLVDFWATWCGPCIAAMPTLKQIHEKYSSKGFAIVGVNLDDERAAVEAFMEEAKLPWPQIVMGSFENPTTERYKIKAIPALFLLDREGKLVLIPVAEEKMLEASIEKLLNS